jgi:hypothetical protein
MCTFLLFSPKKSFTVITDSTHALPFAPALETTHVDICVLTLLPCFFNVLWMPVAKQTHRLEKDRNTIGIESLFQRR